MLPDVDKSMLASVNDVTQGHYGLLYSAPEAILCGEEWKRLLLIPPLSKNIIAVAIDKAHYVFKWWVAMHIHITVFASLTGMSFVGRSREFRPAFDRLHELRAYIPFGTVMLAVTATVTEAMKEDIIVKLDMVGCSTVSVSPNKPNIYYEVLRKSTV